MVTVYTREESVFVSNGLAEINFEKYKAEVDIEVAAYLVRAEPHNFSLTPFPGTVKSRRRASAKETS